MQIDSARRELEDRGFSVVSQLVPSLVRRAVAYEAIRLVEHAGVRRDLVLAETGFTPRQMRNVTRAQIAESGSRIPRIYQSEVLLEGLSQLIGEPVHRCPYEPEQFVVTRLEHAGDTHGWHWDDYSFALVWIAECPPAADGGFVECVPGTAWDKQDPGIEKILRERDVHRLEIGAGEVYLMRTKTTMHRVHPLQRGRRTIVNMAFAAAGELSMPVSHETMDALWSVPQVRTNGVVRCNEFS
ncbi:HalD/BesD family halogenase [Nocardia sp. NBC_01327]|uniref:HalD/BesD family halogenase n=1 Tax=Nocardia sp. NBC_01327 TaxID=2903593 RepID=UPI002E1421C7|nr:hypothetical protein OG326_15145 [Nocardia sp. NBC_01327]